jgi:4-hydroxy-3-polyprenylbenzoate decarboxylase
MAYKDLPAFIADLEKRGQLKRIAAEVDPCLEITEIADRVVKQGGPALLFEKVRGSAYPVFINGFGSRERMSLALGVGDLDEIGGRIAGLLDFSAYMSLGGKIKALPQLAPLLAMFPLHKPGRGPCQQVVEKDPDLGSLPVLKCWPGDGGRFFTLPLVVTRDPDTGMQNLGMYRMQVYDKNTTGMHWHLHKDGRALFEKYRQRKERMPVAVALGCDPAVTYAATAPLPPMIDEMLFAGFLRKKPVTTVTCLTCPIEVPQDAEFILEGYVDPEEELKTEGPFGDHTGYYSLEDLYPVFHLTALTRKRKPVYPATIVGRPPMEDCFLAKATERIFLPVIKMLYPEIIDFHFPLEGVFHNCVIVSLKKRYPGHPRKIMHSLWGLGQLMYTKMIIVVDETIPPQDISQVMWKVFNNIDAGRDLELSPGPLDALDHASALPHYGMRLGIDATKKGPEEGHTRPWPEDILMSPEIRALVDKKWGAYGLGPEK